MSPIPAPAVAQRRSGLESCPSCGQPLHDQRAVRRLHRSEREFERILEAAVRARLAELADELAARLEAEHRETLNHLESHVRGDEDLLASVRARHAEQVFKLRAIFRQF